MAPDQLKSRLERRPFLPFQLRLADGRSFRITMPDEVRPGPECRWIWFAAAGDPFNRLDFSEVQAIIDEAVPETYVADRSENGASMTIEKFDEYLKRKPFVPFTIHTADGASFEVKSPEFAARTQQGRTIFVSTGGEHTEWIDLLLVTRLSSGVENPKAA